MIQRTKIITLMLLGLLFTNLSAQDSFEDDKAAKLPDDDRTYRFGLQISPNISWLKSSTVDYNCGGSKVGFSYGLSFEYFMTKNYLFSTGVFMLSTGGALEYPGAGILIDSGTGNSSVVPIGLKVDYRIKHVEIPLLLKLRTNEIGYLTYYGQFGLNLAFNYKSEKKYTALGSELVSFGDEAESSNLSASDDINFFNTSLVIGAGLEYNISGNTSLSIGITYNNGFVDQLDSRVVEFDDSGTPLLNSAGEILESENGVNANLNYFALNIGIFF